MNILIVDDKQEARYMLEVLLKSRKHNVISAVNGNEALKLLNKNEIELIISDILMPEMDGFKFCQYLKRDEILKKIPFIFYSATYVEKKDEEFAYGLGADLFLRKPMAPDQLLSSIEGLISKIQTGRYQPQELRLKREEDIYKLYNERLVNKLEKKIDQLEAEIEKRKKIESQLKTTVKEKEILLQELFHRTKNNIQVISSMLRMKARNLTDPHIAEAFTDIENKILAMALVHQKLYETKDLSHILLLDYLKDLSELLKTSLLDKSSGIEINVNGENQQVLFDTALPIGFIINELITNSIKHAFIPEKTGVIQISLETGNEKEIILKYSDNGKGLRKDFDDERDSRLGLQTIRDLVEYQMQGKMKLVGNDGFSVEISLVNEVYTSRI